MTHRKLSKKYFSVHLSKFTPERSCLSLTLRRLQNLGLLPNCTSRSISIISLHNYFKRLVFSSLANSQTYMVASSWKTYQDAKNLLEPETPKPETPWKWHRHLNCIQPKRTHYLNNFFNKHCFEQNEAVCLENFLSQNLFVAPVTLITELIRS